VALVPAGFRIRRGSEHQIGATADQDRHRPDRQDHEMIGRWWSRARCNPLEAAVPSMHGFQMPAARTAMLHSGCAHLIDKPHSPSLVT
jgi:hypothetical protein